jgi:hypothetical protein
VLYQLSYTPSPAVSDQLSAISNSQIVVKLEADR